MFSISRLLVKGSLFALIFASCCQQVSAQTETTTESTPTTTETSAGSTGSAAGSAQPETAGDSDVDTEIDFGFAVDPGFGVNPNPDSGNAPNIVDGLTSKINDLIDNRPTAGWNEVEELEDYCADDPAICEPAVFATSSNPLDFTENDTLLADESLYPILKDFHNPPWTLI